MASLMSVQWTTRRFASLLCQSTLAASQCRISLAPHAIGGIGIVHVLPQHPPKRNATGLAVALSKTNPRNLTWRDSQIALDSDTVMDKNLLKCVRDSPMCYCEETSHCEVDFCEETVSRRSVTNERRAGRQPECISDVETSYRREVIDRSRLTDFGGVSSGVLCTSSRDMECMRFSDDVKLNEKGDSPKKDANGPPNEDQLNNIRNFMIEQLPDVFSKQHEYRIYTKDLIFENNWNIDKPYTVVGITAYVLKLFKARMYIHGKYAKVKVSVLSATIDIPGSMVVVRWRIAGLPQIKAFMFWKYVPFKIKAKGREESEWLDGLSTFYVNGSGFIQKHRIDRVIADNDFAKKTPKVVVKSALGLQGT